MALRELENRTILHGDVLEKIKEIPNESIDCVISSPPYWGLRDYGVSGQWGLEPDFKDYLAHLRELMNELRRVLKDSGTCWMNMGDTYSGGYAHSDWSGTDPDFYPKMEEKGQFSSIRKNQIKPKSRFGMPERFYVQCIDDGWIARNHIPWVKSNPMPNSVKDRFTNSWESIFFFAKNEKYFFDLDAIRESPKGGYLKFNRRIRDAKKLRQMGLDGAMVKAKASDEEIGNYQPGERSHFGTGSDIKLHMDRKWENIEGQTVQTIAKIHSGEFDKETGENLNNPKGKNPGDVFFINSKPFIEAHFATFPLNLPYKIISCSCPEKGVVLDPFFGSGTVGVAAEMLDRHWIGIELSEKYIELARKRLSKYSNQRLV